MSTLIASTADEMRQIGATIGRALHAGDVVILDGPLGAGKTTLTQGIADGLSVRGPITSPTFVISRVHPSLTDGPALIHVDAYRINSLAEIDDLDLDTDLERAVLVAEWGSGKLDAIAQQHITISVARGDDDVRTLNIEGLEL